MRISPIREARSDLNVLRRKFPQIEPKTVREAYFRNARLFHDSPVKKYIPIFVMKGAAEELGEIKNEREGIVPEARVVQIARATALPQVAEAQKSITRRCAEFIMATLARWFGPTTGGSAIPSGEQA